MKRNWFALLLALVAVVALLAFPTAHATEESESGTAGEGVYWTLDSKGLLTVYGNGEITSAPWRADYAKVIKQVVIEEGVTAIKANAAFDSLSSLTSVSLPDSLTYIGQDAFEYCTSLESVVIPENVTYVGSWAFSGCDGLKNVTMPTVLPEFGSSVFSSYTLENVYISDLYGWCSLNFASISIRYENLILNGTTITDLEIPEGITTISNYAFDYWTNLETVTIPESVTSIGSYAFEGCENLREVNLSNGITALHSYVFAFCPSLTSITLPESILVIDSAVFSAGWNQTSGIEEIRFLGDAPSIASDAFYTVAADACYSAENPTWTEDMFRDYGGTITWIADPTIPATGTTDAVTVVDSGTCGENATWELNSLGKLIVSGSGEITSAPWRADYAKVIKQVVIEEGVTAIKANAAFDSLSSLTSVSLPDSLTYIGQDAFEYCASLESIVIPENVTYVGSWAFSGCDSLKNVTMPTVLPEFGSSVFSSYTLENVYISDLYGWCSLNFASISIRYENLILNGTPITDLEIPEGITTISNYAFDYWTNLETVTIPESVTSIGSYAFEGCENLREVNLSNGITALHSYVFAFCPSLTSITLPESILVIDSAVFSAGWNQTSGIEEIRFLGNAPLIASDAFYTVTADVHYSAENPSWKEEKLLDYGGTIQWIPDDSIPTTGVAGDVMTVESGSCGDGVEWELNTDGLLTVFGNGEITSAPWRADYAKVIKQVVIEEGVTAIKANAAFDSLSSLTSVSLPDSLTYIGQDAFEYCTALESIVIPENVTYVGSWAFSGCDGLKNVTMPTVLPEFGSSVFSSYTLENVYISDLYGWCSLNFASISIRYENLVLNGTTITDLEIPEGITTISNYAFDYWTNLETVTIPESVTSIGSYAFEGCENLREVNLSNGITALHSYVFAFCPSLTSITLPESILVIDSAVFSAGWNQTSGIEEIRFLGNAPLIASDAFYTVTASAYYSQHNSSWTEDVFQNYGGTITWIADPDIPGTGVEPEVYIVASGSCGPNVYWELDSNGVLVIYGQTDESGTESYDMDDYASPEETPWYDYQEQIQSVVVESTVDSIGDNAFAQCENLEEVVVEEGVEDIGAGAFAQCESLEEVTFEGSAPEFGEGCFEDVEATVSYPEEDPTWEEVDMEATGGEIAMEPYVPEEEPTEPSEPTEPEPTEPAPTEPAPTEPTEPAPTEPTEPAPTEPTEPEDPGVPGQEGVIRLSGANRYATGFAVANQLKEKLGVDKFSAVVVAYGQNFPDALTGSYLAAVKNVPILLTEPSQDQAVLTYLNQNLAPGGMVYILGGTAAVSQEFEDAARLLNFQAKRLKGAGRYETNLAILREAGVNTTDEVLIATGTNYADSLSASATGLPMLLVDKVLSDSQKEFLEGTSRKFVIIGGTGAVSAEIADELAAIGEVTRIKGANRYGTSVEIAKRYFSNPSAAVLAYAQGFPDGLCGGPLALSMGAPLILTSNESFAIADEYVAGITSGAVTGGTGRISDDTVREIFDLPGDTPIAKP